MPKHLATRQLTAIQAADAATRLFGRMYTSRSSLPWIDVADRCRELAGRARTGRALARLVRMAVYAEIQANVGCNIDETEAQREWARYVRQEA